MAVEFHCPHCGQLLSAPDEAAGTTGTCRFCGAAIVAPHSSVEAPRLLQPGEPTKAPYGTPSSNQPTGYIDPGAILSDSWRTLVANWALVLGAQWLAMLIMLAAMVPVFAVTFERSFAAASSGSPFGAQAAMTMPLWMNIVLSLGMLLLYPLQAAPLFVVDRLLARGDAKVGDLFMFLRHYGALLQYFVLISLPALLIQWLLYPFVYGTGGPPNPALSLPVSGLSVLIWSFMYATFGLGVMEIVDRGGSGLDAMKASWAFTLGHRWAIFASLVLLALAYMAGVIVCCVGWVFTIGLMPIGLVLMYRNLRGLQGTVD